MNFEPTIHVEIYVHLGTGLSGFPLSSNELREFEASPGPVIERKTGVPYGVVLDFVQNNGQPNCMALTSKRKPCKCKVPGVRFSNPKEWHAFPGGYCFAHGEGEK